MTEYKVQYQIKTPVPRKLLMSFLSVWLDDYIGKYNLRDTGNIEITCNDPQDAVYLRVRGLPHEFANHLELLY